MQVISAPQAYQVLARLIKDKKPHNTQESPARELTQAGLFHLVKSFEIGILSQKRIEMLFQLCLPKPVTRIQ